MSYSANHPQNALSRGTPHRLGPYQIESTLGQGAVAVVYRARGPNGGLVALKVLTDMAAAQPKIRKLFQNEYRITSRLNHPGVVRALEAGEVDNHPYVALTLVDGQTLEEFLTKHPTLGEVPAVDIIRQVALTLDYIHQQGIVHRDIKPSNILIAADGRALLFDFGTALNMNARNPDDLDGVYGTPAFIAPEQTERGQEIDGRADLYSLGVVLYRMVAGRKPFYGTREEVLDAHRHEAPPEPSVFAYVSPALESIILKAMAKDPAARFQTGAEMATALSQVELTPPPERVQLPQRILRWFKTTPMASSLGMSNGNTDSA